MVVIGGPDGHEMTGAADAGFPRFPAYGPPCRSASARESYGRPPLVAVRRLSLYRVARLLAHAGCVGMLAACATTPPHPLDGAGPTHAMAVIPAAVLPAAGPSGNASGPSLVKDANDAKAALAASGGVAGVALAVVGVAAIAICPWCAASAVQAVVQGVAIAGGAAVGVHAGGAETGIPAAKQELVARALNDAGAAQNLQRLAADGVVEGIATFAPFRAEVVESAPTPAATATPFLRALRERGYGTALEIAVTRFGLAVANAERFSLFVTMEARLLDTGSGKATWMRGMVYESAAHDLDLWLSDGAALTRAELERGTRVLAERTVDLLVLRTPMRDDHDDLSCGVPVLDAKGTSVGAPPDLGPRPPAATAQSRTPLLAWEPLPRMYLRSAPASWEAVSDRRYDLRLWNVIDDAPGDIVYERQGLTGTRHQVEVPLEPASMYFWSVRLRGTVDGRPRAAPWSAWKLPRFRTQPFLRDARIVGYYRHGDTMTPLVLQEWREFACPILDFIPAENFHRFRTP